MNKYLPEKFAIANKNEKISQVIQSRFKSLGIKWQGGEDIIDEISGPKRAIGFNYNDDQCLSHTTKDFYEEEGIPFVSLEGLLSLDFAPKVNKFQLIKGLTAEIHKDKVICAGYEVSFETVREIAAMREFVVRAPNLRTWRILVEELADEDAEGISFEESDEDWAQFGENTCVDNDGLHNSENFYKKEFPNLPFITLEELFSMSKKKDIYIGGHKVKLENGKFEIGCKSIPRKKIEELAAKLPK